MKTFTLNILPRPTFYRLGFDAMTNSLIILYLQYLKCFLFVYYVSLCKKYKF